MLMQKFLRAAFMDSLSASPQQPKAWHFPAEAQRHAIQKKHVLPRFLQAQMRILNPAALAIILRKYAAGQYSHNFK